MGPYWPDGQVLLIPSIESGTVQTHEVIGGKETPLDFVYEEAEENHYHLEREMNLTEGHLVPLTKGDKDWLQGAQNEGISDRKFMSFLVVYSLKMRGLSVYDRSRARLQLDLVFVNLSIFLQIPLEIQTSFFVSIFLVLLPLCFIIIKGYNKYAKSKQKLPPGPRKLPLIGNLHQLLCLGSSEFQPHVALSKLAAKYGPLMHLKLGQRLVLVVSSAEVSRQFFKTHDLTFSNRPELFVGKIMMYGFSDMAFAPYGDFWRQMRKICNSELLGLKRIHSFFPMMFDEVRDLVKSIAAAEVGKPIDLNERLSLLQFAITCKAAVGRTECTDQESFLMVMKEFVSFAGIFSAADLFPSWKIVQLISGPKRKLTKMHQKAYDIVEQIIREHELKRSGTDGDGKQIEEDIVDVLLGLKESKDFPIPITRNVVKATVFVSSLFLS
uniref:Cytochrome P450 71D8-like n=1 Tax=Nicotiana sylvestris TaxID=4096 RepID=A0A1U7XND3_NICSY|nr:PREDICTED: cytochrome P450 71D8-like [Nicotiana sylvestris]